MMILWCWGLCQSSAVEKSQPCRVDQVLLGP
jgi:hypothetical protein